MRENKNIKDKCEIILNMNEKPKKRISKNEKNLQNKYYLNKSNILSSNASYTKNIDFE